MTRLRTEEPSSSKRGVLNGEECTWADWKIGMIADISVKGRCGDISCTAVHGNDETLREAASGRPLTEGKHGGLEASRETQSAREVKSRGLLDWSFAGEFLAWLALSERDVFKCENHFGEIMTANMNMCIVLQQLDDGTLKQDVLLNNARLSD